MPSEQHSSSASPTIWLINGPNLNRLGTREPAIYGHATLADIEARVERLGRAHNATVQCSQHNEEGAIIARIVEASDASVHALIVNLGAYTHTSIAIADCLAGEAIPYVEVHMSNVAAREPFRHTSYIAKHAIGVISGFGAYSYELALLSALNHLNGHSKPS